MSSIQQDLSIFKKFNFERPPIGVKFLTNKPDGIKKLDKVLDFCEMLPEAQEGNAFYVTKENLTCIGPMELLRAVQCRRLESELNFLHTFDHKGSGRVIWSL